MTMVTQDPVVIEIIEFIKKRLDLPDNIIGLSLHLRLNEVVRVDCQYYPSVKRASEESS